MQSKLFLKPLGAPEIDWKEVSGEIINDSISMSAVKVEPEEPYRFGHYRMSFHAKVKRMAMIRFLQTVGFLKAPKCTYRTTKRACAKRNMRQI